MAAAASAAAMSSTSAGDASAGLFGSSTWGTTSDVGRRTSVDQTWGSPSSVTASSTWGGRVSAGVSNHGGDHYKQYGASPGTSVGVSFGTGTSPGAGPGTGFGSSAFSPSSAFGSGLGGAAQVASIKTRVAPVCFQRLKLKCDLPLSNVAFNFNVRHYT
jgi:hypothetical protein